MEKMIAPFVLFLSAGCLPPLANPPPGTPAKVIEQCGADASAHNLSEWGGGIGGGLGLAGFGIGLGIDNGHNGSTVAAIVTPSAIVGAAGLGIATIGGEATTQKYISDKCVAVTGPLPADVAEPR
jgi:hypothetical protein